MIKIFTPFRGIMCSSNLYTLDSSNTNPHYYV